MAIIDGTDLLPPRARLACGDVVELVRELDPVVVAIDSPCSCAPAGQTTRRCESVVLQQICGIRWTPDATAVHASDYYEWVVEGLKLYDALDAIGVSAIEVFPTASWTRWLGPRGSRRRSTWTRDGLARLGLSNVPARTSQDARDAIAAAVTARQHTLGLTEAIGEIIVPSDLDQPLS